MVPWLTEPPVWKGKLLNLLIDGTHKPVSSPTVNQLIKNSNNFPIKFPTAAIKCETIKKTVAETMLQRNIDSAYPLIHESALHLCARFLVFKCEHGSNIEKKLYKKMNLLDFIQRLLTKKAVFFAGQRDSHLLRSGPLNMGGWEDVGTSDETAPLLLKNYLSYDEMKMSALLSISSYSYFINDGSRIADGSVATSRDGIQSEGVIIGIIGTRLHKPGYMEYQDIIITPSQNGGVQTDDGNVRNVWSSFYEETALQYKDVVNMCTNNNKRFEGYGTDRYFDNATFAKRLIVSFDTLLFEANHRANEKGTMAYVYVVGIGLGVWRVAKHQPQVFADVFVQRISVLGSKLSHISDVHLAYIPGVKVCGAYKDQDVIPIVDHRTTGIKVHISNREPFVKLSDPDKLLVVSYAADANSLPGNEFWVGCLTNSSDSTTASSTQISELHNPHINSRVNVGNLMVVTCGGPLVPVQEYVANIKQKSK